MPMTAKVYCLLSCVWLCAPAWSIAAMEQDVPLSVAPTNDQRKYTPDYFETFAPRTAMDMVRQIPGFQIQENDDNKRGLGQGGANVLINGKRLSGKTEPRDQLSRINAANVVKIELLDGATLDIPGLSGQVVNVHIENTGISGTWEWNPEWRHKLKPSLFNGAATVSGERGNLAYSVAFNSEQERRGNRGPAQRFSADGTLYEIRDEEGKNNEDGPGVSVDLTWTPKPDHIANFSAEYNQFNFSGRELSRHTAYDERGDNQETHFVFGEDEWNASLSGDYERPLGPGTIKLIGYHRSEHSPTKANYRAYEADLGLVENLQYEQLGDEGESIVRAEYTWLRHSNRVWQLAAEGAFNFLDIQNQYSDLFDADNNEADAARVEEKRAEATLSYTRPVNTKLTLQASLGAEYSQISQSGETLDDEYSPSFFRPKGFLLATYTPSDSLTINTKLEREVGQLNFYDFIASVDLEDNLDTAANRNLVPAQSWRGEVEFDKSFGTDNVFKARIYGALISDLVDRIPVVINGVDSDAIGNIDKGSQYGIDLSTTLKAHQGWLEGSELNLGLDLRNSKVKDPVEGFTRRFNRDKKSVWWVDVRQDLSGSDWAYGLHMRQGRRAKTYRLSTINEFRFNGPWGEVYIENKDIVGLKVRASLKNLFDASDDATRIVYTDRRDLGEIDYIEEMDRPFGLFFELGVSGTF